MRSSGIRSIPLRGPAAHLDDAPLATLRTPAHELWITIYDHTI